jgi:hypothetical protein
MLQQLCDKFKKLLGGDVEEPVLLGVSLDEYLMRVVNDKSRCSNVRRMSMRIVEYWNEAGAEYRKWVLDERCRADKLEKGARLITTLSRLAYIGAYMYVYVETAKNPQCTTDRRELACEFIRDALYQRYPEHLQYLNVLYSRAGSKWLCDGAKTWVDTTYDIDSKWANILENYIVLDVQFRRYR